MERIKVRYYDHKADRYFDWSISKWIYPSNDIKKKNVKKVVNRLVERKKTNRYAALYVRIVINKEGTELEIA